MAEAARFNIYTLIHKGLRACMSETLVSVGRLDPNDMTEIAAAVGQVRGLIEFAREHLEHEERWIHPALEARRPGSSAESRDDHSRHLESLASLDSSARALERSEGGERAPMALRLYRQLALFIAENFEHMHVEETENHATLAAYYSEQEVIELHDRLVAAVKPASMMIALRWLVPASSAPERAAMLNGMQHSAPPAAFAAVLELVRSHLSAREWAKLGAAIGPMPGVSAASAVKVDRTGVALPA
jgi:hypothetical protein